MSAVTDERQAEIRPQARQGSRAWTIWLLAATLYVVALFHRMSLGVASLDAVHRFHVNAGALSAFTALQLFVYFIMQVPAGVLADRWGPRRMLTLGMLSMAVGETIFGFSTTLIIGLLGRGLVGFGDALIFLNVLRLVLSWFPAHRYALLAALTGFAGGLGQLLTTVPLQYLLGHVHWTPTFVGAGVVTALLAAFAWLGLRDRPTVAITQVSPTSSDRTAAAASVSHTHTSVRADLRAVLRRRGTYRGFWTHFTLTGPFTMFTALWGYPYLTQAQGRSGSAASALLAVSVVAYVVGSPLVGWAARVPRHRDLLVQSLGAAVTGVWAMAVFWPSVRLPDAALWALLIVTGLGSAGSAAAFDIAREANPPERGGSASGVVNLGGFSLATVAALAVGGVLDTFAQTQPAHAVAGSFYGPAAFRIALLPLFVLVLAGFTQIVRLTRAHQRDLQPLTV